MESWHYLAQSHTTISTLQTPFWSVGVTKPSSDQADVSGSLLDGIMRKQLLSNKRERPGDRSLSLFPLPASCTSEIRIPCLMVERRPHHHESEKASRMLKMAEQEIGQSIKLCPWRLPATNGRSQTCHYIKLHLDNLLLLGVYCHSWTQHFLTHNYI